MQGQGEDSAPQAMDASPQLAWGYLIFNYSHQTAVRKHRELKGEGRWRGTCQLLSASAETRVLILLLFLIKLF